MLLLLLGVLIKLRKKQSATTAQPKPSRAGQQVAEPQKG
jgi:hypothetical protein